VFPLLATVNAAARTLEYTLLSEHLFPVLLGPFLGVELLGHISNSMEFIEECWGRSPPRARHTLGKYCTTELHPQSPGLIFFDA
jgi:hypothetical protein